MHYNSCYTSLRDISLASDRPLRRNRRGTFSWTGDYDATCKLEIGYQNRSTPSSAVVVKSLRSKDLPHYIVSIEAVESSNTALAKDFFTFVSSYGTSFVSCSIAATI